MIFRERARTEALLKQEISHQVAERSKELGEAVSKVALALPVATLVPGRRFAERYTVVRQLGSGAMGVVHEVERITDQQRFALKVVSGSVTGAQAARFAREVEIGARMRHRNLVSIVDVGISGGAPFLVMEMAEHGSLEEQRSRFGDAVWALRVLGEVASGLAALHAGGVIHRDLKPGNVLFSSAEDGAIVAKISDFGISRFGARGAADAHENAIHSGGPSTSLPPSLGH